MEQLKIEIQNRYKKLLLNKKEASKELGISISTLDRLRKTGYLKEKRIGGLIVIGMSQLQNCYKFLHRELTLKILLTMRNLDCS